MENLEQIVEEQEEGLTQEEEILEKQKSEIRSKIYNLTDIATYIAEFVAYCNVTSIEINNSIFQIPQIFLDEILKEMEGFIGLYEQIYRNKDIQERLIKSSMSYELEQINKYLKFVLLHFKRVSSEQEQSKLYVIEISAIEIIARKMLELTQYIQENYLSNSGE